MKNAISEINNTMEGINSKLDEAVDHISDGRQGRKKKNHPGRAAKRIKNF